MEMQPNRYVAIYTCTLSIKSLTQIEFQTVVRMNKLQVCMSAEATLQKLDECAQGHDAKVKQWIASQVEYLVFCLNLLPYSHTIILPKSMVSY